MGRTVLRGGLVLGGSDLALTPQPVDIVIEGDRIRSIGASHYVQDQDDVLDMSGRLVVPGMINGHFHSSEHFQKGRVENLPLELWMQYMRAPLAVELTARQTYLRTMIGAIEALRSGTTTVVDDLIPGPRLNQENIKAALQAYKDIGIRALVGFAMFDRAVVDHFPFVDEAFSPAEIARLRALPRPDGMAVVAFCKDLLREHHPRSSRVGVIVSASAPQRCTEEFLRHCRRFADENELAIITHVQETRLQVVTGGEFYGMPMVEYLDRIGFLAPRTTLIHTVWLNPREIEALARTGATAQHNPWSNLTLGSGLQPVRELLEAGVNVSMGSDGTCSTMTANMLTVVGSAAALSKIRGDDYSRWLSAKEALQAATQGGAKALGFEGELGVIQPGAIADLVGYRLDTVSFSPLNDAVRQLVYSERGLGVDFSMIAGEVVMLDGQLTRIREREMLADIAREHADLRDRLAREETLIAPVVASMEKIYRRSLALPIPSDTFTARIASGKP
jgi:5-methylthioadenosine/S-adenosylhomocysteine deaminase